MRRGSEIKSRDQVFDLMKEGSDMIMESSRGSDFGEVLLANRMPLALIGIGVAWLLASNAGWTNRAVRHNGEPAGDTGIGLGSAPKDHAGQVEPILGPDGGPLSRSGDTGRSEGWVHQAAGAAKGAISSVRDAGSAVLDRASRYTDYAGGASNAAKRAGGQIAEKLERDPWAIGVAGLVAGALVAALLPATRFEQECVGEARDELWHRAAQFGHDAAERVRELADATARASKP
jgi:hypothetical protein